MTAFRYKAYDQRGALTEGVLESGTREAALDALHRRGVYPFDVAADAKNTTPIRWWEREVLASASLPLAGLSVFTRELATLIKADLPLDESLRIVALQPLIPARVRRCTQTLHDTVRRGSSLSAAMSAQGEEFPEYYWRLIEAGETSGSLGEVLDDLAGFVERATETRSQVSAALLYPTVLLIASVLTVAVIVTVLVPSVMPLFDEAGAQPPALLRWLTYGYNLVVTQWPIMLVALLGLLLGFVALAKVSTLRETVDRWILRVPFFGRVVANRETARFAQTLATMIRNGVPMLDAVRVSGSVLSNRAFKAAVADTGEALKEGGTLSEPLQRSGLFSDLSLRLTAVGEQTGQLDTMLARVASIYEATVARQMARFVTLLTPALTLVIGVIVGSLILSVMGAILSVNDLALR